jgi:acylphosphatase
MKRFELTLLGKVQGVNYRREAARKAKSLGVTGTVWNEPDGSVVVVAEGLPRKLDAFLAWAQAGPAAAKVVEHEVDWQTATGQYEDFTVRI